jgi:type I restriction enzyme, R subunit
MNKNSEQIARDQIDAMLQYRGWLMLDNKEVSLSASNGRLIKECLTDVGPADYIFFVDSKSVGLIEAKRQEEGHCIMMHEDQSNQYVTAKLRNLNQQSLLFVYKSTSEMSLFAHFRNPKPHSCPVFSSRRPEN